MSRSIGEKEGGRGEGGEVRIRRNRRKSRKKEEEHQRGGGKIRVSDK